jgi:hypothetical protein
MRQRRVLAVLLLLWVSLGGVRDGNTFETAEEFLRQCGAPLDKIPPLHVGQCLGYIAGAVEGYRSATWALETHMRGRLPLLCPPDSGPKPEIVFDHILGWLRRHPWWQSAQAGMAILMALAETYPCEPGTKKK